ncbi:MAG: STAS domain-containing protein [Spirochaetes bacterium]|nr:STAS domain-containing protein [Spirochaetota bacterium]
MGEKKSSKSSCIHGQIKKGILFIDIVENNGSIDIKNVHIITNMVNDAIKRNGKAVQIDCINIKFIDTSGLGKLLAISKKIEVILQNVNPKIKRIMDITNLSAFFTFIK